MDVIREENASSDLHLELCMEMRQAARTCVAYGVLVSLEILGARLEAYKESRVTLAAFERCTEDLPRLPQEVRQMIANEVQQSAYEEYLDWWKAANECCKNICEGRHDGDGDPSKMIAKFVKCRKVFEEDFGLEIRFMVHRIFNPEDNHHACILLAYIILPPILEAGMMESGDGDRKYPTFSVCSWAAIDPIPEPTPKQKELFQTVLKTLHLQPMDHNIPDDPDLEEDIEVPASPTANFPKLLILTSGMVGPG